MFVNFNARQQERRRGAIRGLTTDDADLFELLFHWKMRAKVEFRRQRHLRLKMNGQSAVEEWKTYSKGYVEDLV